MRERLKSAITRASQLEQELAELKSNYTAPERKSTSVVISQNPSTKSDVCSNADAPNVQGAYGLICLIKGIRFNKIFLLPVL